MHLYHPIEQLMAVLHGNVNNYKISENCTYASLGCHIFTPILELIGQEDR